VPPWTYIAALGLLEPTGTVAVETGASAVCAVFVTRGGSGSLEHHAFGKVSVHSAGSKPTSTIPKTVTEVLAELRIDLTEAFSKPLTD
jgi:hypothetical protein